MKVSVSDLEKLIGDRPELKFGCMIDTNLLFAATFTKDQHNEWAEEVFRVLSELGIPCFTNINIRSEFLDLCRRVYIPEGLMDFYEDFNGSLSDVTEHKLKSLRTRMDKATQTAFKLGEKEIKEWRSLFDQSSHPSGKKGWDVFCEEYFGRYFINIWDDAVHDFKLQFVGTRAIDRKDLFNSDPDWPSAEEIIRKTGIGSSDAMILNLFFCSKFLLLISADSDALWAIEKLNARTKLLLFPS